MNDIAAIVLTVLAAVSASLMFASGLNRRPLKPVDEPKAFDEIDSIYLEYEAKGAGDA